MGPNGTRIHIVWHGSPSRFADGDSAFSIPNLTSAQFSYEASPHLLLVNGHTHAPCAGANASITDDLEMRFAFPGEASHVMRDYFCRDADGACLSWKFRMYYRLRPWIPISARLLLQRGRNRGIDVPRDWFLPTDFSQALRATALRNPDQQVIHPWPDDHRMAVCLTHDVETQTGVGLVDRLARLEKSLGFRSAWNFVPHKYKLDYGLMSDLQDRGHEICVHGYNHDGRLFESRRTFNQRTKHINKAMRDFNSRGFRAPMVHRNLKWMQALDADYDASCFDVDPFQAMSGGIGSMWPFLAGKLVELPYTMPQDHTLLVTLGERTPQAWIVKLAYLRQHSAMALLITHPDHLDTASALKVYDEFLKHLREQPNTWLALPHEISQWWRTRDAMKIQSCDTSSTITGDHAERARIASLSSLFS